MVCASSLRVLGLSSSATKAEVKAAFLRLAKEWHPDKHQGRGKAQAEVRFKQIAEAYENLADGGGGGGAGYSGGVNGPGRHAQGSGTRRPGPERERAYETWGTQEQYGPASRSGYNAFAGYMDFGPGTPAGEARARTEQRQRQRMRMSLCFFLFGFGIITWTARRDNEKRNKGELVDAFYNNVSSCCRSHCPYSRVLLPLADARAAAEPRPLCRRHPSGIPHLFPTRSWIASAYSGAPGMLVVIITSRPPLTDPPSRSQATRRWEKATPAMKRDPLLSTLVHLKSPGMVYGHGLTGTGGTQARVVRKQAQTLDGQNASDAYRARAQGTRS